MSVWDRLRERPGGAVLDGGLATELERDGHDLDHPLWSARVLLEDPGAIAAVHRRYLDAGADCITTASYQASVPGFTRVGLCEEDGRTAIRASVEIARHARDAFAAERSAGFVPLVAASVGPYGALLADGSEYRGDYSISDADLHRFHAERWELFAATGADLLACETIPSLTEVTCLLRLFEATPGCAGWISVSCRDGGHISDGTPIEAVADRFEGAWPDVGMGVNCTAPEHVSGVLRRLRARAPHRAIVVYPNSGEHWEENTHTWCGSGESWVDRVPEWRRLGAVLIGGCCRTTPADIAAIRSAASG